MSETVVKLDGISKEYHMGEMIVHALKGIDLEVKRGEFLAIMGSSGSGKSSMLNVLGCLDRPSKGHYYLGDVDVANMNDEDLSTIRSQRIGFIFQSFNLIEQLTVQENIEVPLFYQNTPPKVAAERAIELATMVGLETRLDHRPSELSGGQMQRVAIARALANNPYILLADEPTGNLDSKTETEILDMFDDLNRQGMTIIVVTHDDPVAERAQRVITLKDGLVDHERFNS
ncbi:MAG: ABC transporter ATP-binding protein [Lentisphaeria bacterium]|nr:ABC transporter ATP-binding protein [Lentisphaeria bacterium]